MEEPTNYRKVNSLSKVEYSKMNLPSHDGYCLIKIIIKLLFMQFMYLIPYILEVVIMCMEGYRLE